MEKDIRGIDLKADNFKTQLINIINNSNLPPSLIMYILKDIYEEVVSLYNKSVSQQYEEMCEIAKKEKEAAVQENDESAAADSDNIDDK